MPIDDRFELYQVPGASAFFSAARDVLVEASSAGSITNTFADTVHSDATTLDLYILHNDDSHGGEFDGCGFLAQQQKIYRTAASMADELIARVDQNRYTAFSDAEKTLLQHIAKACGRLAESDTYFSLSGGELVEKAVKEWGVTLATYTGDHTAIRVRYSGKEDETYDSRIANDASHDSQSSFNLDINHIRPRCEAFDLDPEGTRLFAELITAATVEVLGPIAKIDQE